MCTRGTAEALPFRGMAGGRTLSQGRLSVQQQPASNALSGVGLLPQPIFAALDGAGNLDTSFVGLVTITVNGPLGITGSVSVLAVAGVATFVGLALTGAGAVTLTASTPTRLPVTTNTITVT